jgi:hypothetical protein
MKTLADSWRGESVSSAAVIAMMVLQRTRGSSPPWARDCGENSDTKEEQSVPPITGSGAQNNTEEGHQLFAHRRDIR